MIKYIAHKEDLFHWSDPFIALAYILIIYIIALFIKGAFIEKHSEYKYLIKGLTIKIVGAIAFTMIYLFYYDDGDTILYFEGSRALTKVLIESPSEFLRFIFSSHHLEPSLQYIRQHITYSKSPEEWFMVKLLTPINILSFNRFLIAQIVMSVVTMIGSWKMFQAFLFFYPEKKKEAFYAVFLIPSVILWGSGILKDSVTFAFLGLLFYFSVKNIYQLKVNFKAYTIIALSIYLIFNIKAYIILGFLPAITIGWVAYNRDRIKSKFLRNILTPFILVIAIGIGGEVVKNLQADSDKYAADNIKSRIDGFHTWHTLLGGSSYDLGEIEYTPLGILKVFPSAVNVTFFRPYITEISSAAISIGAIQSSYFLLLFIFILFHYRLSWLRTIFKEPLLLLSFTFSLIFGFMIGFTSYNFGALDRYKIPVMPFFAYILFYFYFEYKDKKKADKLAKETLLDLKKMF